jgi:hypothetical protein
MISALLSENGAIITYVTENEGLKRKLMKK